MPQAELFLACPHCRRVVVVSYDAAAHHQGNVDLDEHRNCYRCGREMVETERDEEGRIICPNVGDPPPKATRWPVVPEKRT